MNTKTIGLAGAAALAVAAGNAAAQECWIIEDLAAQSYAQAVAINDDGCVVGRVGAYPNDHAFVYRDSLETLYDGGYRSGAFDIHNSGRMCGWNGAATVWTGSGSGDRITLPGGSAAALALNAIGDLAGHWSPSDGEYQAAFWRGNGQGSWGSREQLDPPGGDLTWAQVRGLNSSRVAVGFASNAGAVPYAAVLWADDGGQFGAPELLETPGFQNSLCYDINDDGVAVGRAWNTGEPQRAVRWVNGQMQELGIDGGALGVNQQGVICGFWYDQDGSFWPFVWQDGVVETYRDELEAYSNDMYENAEAWDINSSGALAVTAYSNGTSTRFAVRMIPPCYANFNCDFAVNTQDVLDFLNAWTASDLSADCNGDGTVNTIDFLCFLNIWAGGC